MMDGCWEGGVQMDGWGEGGREGGREAWMEGRREGGLSEQSLGRGLVQSLTVSVPRHLFDRGLAAGFEVGF